MDLSEVVKRYNELNAECLNGAGVCPEQDEIDFDLALIGLCMTECWCVTDSVHFILADMSASNREQFEHGLKEGWYDRLVR